MITTFFSTYLAGFLTSLTPCVYPMIPLSLGYLGARSKNIKLTVLCFTLGQVLAFTSMGLLAVQLGEVFGFLSESQFFQFTVGSLLLVFAFFSMKGELPGFMMKLNSIKTKEVDQKNTPLAGMIFKSLIAGAISALVASPCSTPVLGGVLLMISQIESQIQGMVYMFAYGLGLSTLFLIMGLGLIQMKSIPKSGQWMIYVHKFSVGLLVLSSFYFFAKGFRII